MTGPRYAPALVLALVAFSTGTSSAAPSQLGSMKLGEVAVLIAEAEATDAPTTSAEAIEAAFARMHPVVRTGLDAGLEAAANVRTAIEGSSFVSRITALSGEGSVPAPAIPVLPAPTAEDFAGVAELDRALRLPIAGLSAAVREAADMLDDVPAKDLGRAFASVMSGLPRTLLPARDATGRIPDSVLGPRPAPIPASVEAAGPDAQRAALTIAAALDAYLPAIQAGAGTTPVAAEPVEGCDRVDETPFLCIGSEVDNVFKEDAMLLVDLGGKDVYRNTAGGAAFPMGTDVARVSVNVDLGGNDRYEATRAFTELSPGATVLVAQGASIPSTVGILVDTAGSDVYTSELPPPTGELPRSWGVAQGSATYNAGVGALVDLGGNDRYVAKGPTVGVHTGTISAQGAGAGTCSSNARFEDGFSQGSYVCTLGFGGQLVDLGEGNDTYELDAGFTDVPAGSLASEPGKGFTVPSRIALGQGGASAAASVLYDGGGSDSFSATASSRHVGTDSFWALGPAAVVAAQGVANAGSTYLLTGTGDTEYRLDVNVEGMGFFTWVEGQGQGSAFGNAVLEDRGGDDTYTAGSTMRYELDRVVSDDCGCESARAEFNGWGNHNRVRVQGSQAHPAGRAMLVDRGGNDTYEAFAEQHLSVSLEDRLTAPSSPPSLSVESWIPPGIHAQGQGGVLLDEAGTDRYEIQNVSEAKGSAGPSGPKGSPEVVTKSSMSYHDLSGHGAMNGALLDLGGSGDRFEANLVQSMEATPGPAFARAFWPSVQGQMDGVFLAAGEEPVVRSGPATAVCPPSTSGYRGYGVWTNCLVNGDGPEEDMLRSGNRGAGFAPAASLPGRSDLSFAPGTPTEITESSFTEEPSPNTQFLTSAMRLHDGEGNPVEGALVHVFLQSRLATANGPVDIRWPIWRVDVVTGPDGTAEARVPLAHVAPALYSFRLLAVYDGRAADGGEPALTPRMVAYPLTVVPA